LEYPEFAEYIDKLVSPEWIPTVNEMRTRLQRGKETAEQINILGDDGVPLSYHITLWKSELIDFVFLQQDAFDDIDAVTPIARQKYMAYLVMRICRTEFEFSAFEDVMDYFKKMINICKQMNYSKFQSDKFERLEKELEDLVQERAVQI
jgi:V/A-type H+-transporting ATPase subunit A